MPESTAPTEGHVRIAAVGDLHCTRTSTGRLGPLFSQAAKAADVLILCGDLTDYGLPEEAHVLAHELAAAGSLPVLAVLGNHDFEAGRQDDVSRILEDAGVILLEGESYEVHGVSFAGAKGFGGGFGSHALQPWGESAMKAFVREALDETLKLESALAKSRTDVRVAALHYSPIPETVVGEPLEIFAFLGSSRLAEPIERYGVTAVFHSHAHRGSPFGRTRIGIPVYNVSLPMRRNRFPHALPFEVVTVPRPPAKDVLV